MRVINIGGEPAPQQQPQQQLAPAVPQGQQQPAVVGIDPISKLIRWFQANALIFRFIALVVALVMLYMFIRNPSSLKELSSWSKGLFLLYWGAVLISFYGEGSLGWIGRIMVALLVVAIVLLLFNLEPKNIGVEIKGFAQGFKGFVVSSAEKAEKKQDKGVLVELKPGRCPTGLYVKKGQLIRYSDWTVDFSAMEDCPLVRKSHPLHRANSDSHLVLWGKGKGEVYVKVL